MMIGYCRVSTSEQDTSLQRAAMAAFGVTELYEDKRSGASGVHRPQLDALVARLVTGDVLVVYKVDRLARSLIDLMTLLAALERRGCAFKSLTEPIETTTAAGKLMVQILGAFAEFERAVIKERCTAGRISARARGVEFGRPPLLTRADVQLVFDQGLPIHRAAIKLGVSRDSMKRALIKYGFKLPDARGAYLKKADHTEVARLSSIGWKNSAIADHFQCSDSLVTKILSYWASRPAISDPPDLPAYTLARNDGPAAWEVVQ